MRRSPNRSAAAKATIGRCATSVAGYGRAWVKRHRTQDGSPWVRSSIVPLRTGCWTKSTQGRPKGSRRGANLGPSVTPDSLVVDATPKIAIVIGVGNGDLLAGLLHRSAY